MYELSHRDDACLCALDETRIVLEPDSLYGWASKGLPLYTEANANHKGVNVTGAAEILKGHKPCYSMHSSWKATESQYVGESVYKLMRTNRDKEARVTMNNCRPHRSMTPEYESKYRRRLHFMFLPPYSLEVNPQENVWAPLRDYCARHSTYSADDELTRRIHELFIYAYNTPCKTRRLVDDRVYFVTAWFRFGVAYLQRRSG